MRRRELFAAVGLLLIAIEGSAQAQQAERVRRIGLLLSGAGGPEDLLAPLEIQAFVDTLHNLGWAEGRNIEIIHRNSEGREKLRENVRQLVDLAPDVILTVGGIAAVDLLAATRTIPVVFTVAADPLTSGLVQSLSHPGGNATGFAAQEEAIGGKWVELLKEIVPRLKRALVIMQADSPSRRVMRDSIRPRTGWRLGRTVKWHCYSARSGGPCARCALPPAGDLQLSSLRKNWGTDFVRL
jgi:putative ABC transport system substrate-binding protein